MAFDYLKYRLKYRYGRYLNLDAPVDVALELSSHCNMACEYCYHSDPKNLPFTKGHMGFEFATKIIRECHAIGVSSLKMNYRGESTLNPSFRNICEFAWHMSQWGEGFIERITNSNFKFRTTNLDIFEGLSYQTKIKVSLDSFNKEVFETQRKGGRHNLTMSNIDRFYDEFFQGNIPNQQLVIQAVITNRNKDEDIKGLVKKRWPKATVSIRDMVEGRVNKNLEDLTTKKRDVSSRHPCLQAFVRLIVHWDGKVNVCCPAINNDLIVGDATKQTLKEIFNSPTVKYLRHSLKNKTAFQTRKACLNCSSFESYKGYKHPWGS